MTQVGDAFGSLTALFTSDGPAAETPAADPLVAAPVVVALIGNMPVMAGLWTTKLADEIASNGGPTALVRFERGEVTIELLRAEGRHLPPAAQDAVSKWIPRAASFVRRWLVCVSAETAPSEIVASGAEVLLMTGADDAAKVHAYHRLKHLSEEATGRGQPLSRVGLVVVGAPDDRVDAVGASLSEATRSFLGLELAVVARLPTLDRVQSSARVSYPAGETPTFDEFMRALTAARADSARRFDSEPKTATDTVPAEESTMHTAVPSPQAPAVRAPRTPAQAGAPASSSKLIPFLRGVRAMGVSCPYAPDVELALDDAGRMQIIGRADQLARVRTAHNWARQHQQLLAVAFPELARQFIVVERLLLNDAREAISLHGTGVLLDLVVHVETPNGPVSTVVALNDPASAGVVGA